MIVIAWYNVIGWVVGFVLLYNLILWYTANRKATSWLDFTEVKPALISIACIIFLLVWGGIFWW